MEEGILLIGKIIGFHGLKGEMKVKVLTDFPERFAVNAHLKVGWPDSSRKPEEVVLETVRQHKDNLLVKFKGLDSRTAAAPYGGALFQIDEKSAKPLPEGRYYEFQIIGLKACYLDGAPVGVVKKILSMRHHDVYVIEGEEDVLVPALKKVIKRVDLDQGTLWIDREMMTYLED
jgi:16S rRNA processing protein RimM